MPPPRDKEGVSGAGGLDGQTAFLEFFISFKLRDRKGWSVLRTTGGPTD